MKPGNARWLCTHLEFFFIIFIYLCVHMEVSCILSVLCFHCVYSGDWSQVRPASSFNCWVVLQALFIHSYLSITSPPPLMCVCVVYVCVGYTFVCWWAHPCSNIWRPEVNIRPFLSSSSTFLWERASHGNWISRFELDWLASNSRIYLCLASQSWNYRQLCPFLTR